MRRVEAWTLPDDPGGFRRIHGDVPISAATTNDPTDAVGVGSITVPAAWEHLDLLLHETPDDPASGVQSLLSLWRDGADTPDFEWFAEESNEQMGDDGQEARIIAGRCVRSALDHAVVHPDPVTGQDSIWGGADLLPTPRGVDDLSSLRATFRFSLPGERYEVVPTGGDWSLTVGSDTTDDMSESASAATVKEELEALPGVTEVTVSKEDGGLFTIEFVRPRQVPGLTATNAGVALVHSGFDSSTNPTFTLTVTTDAGSDTTGPLAWNASTNAIEGTPHDGGSGLQGLSNVQDVTVGGQGTWSDPWIITFVRPAVAALAVTTSIDYDLVETQAGQPDPGPFTQSQQIDQRADTDTEPNHGTYGDPPVEVVTDQVRDGSSWSLRVNATGQFGGTQAVINATPGELMQVHVWVRVELPTRMRLVVRDPWEGLVKAQQWETTVPANTWTRLDVHDVVAPPGVDWLIVRIAIVDPLPDTWQHFWVDWEGSMVAEGRVAATAGEILGTLKAEAQARGGLTWLADAFDNDFDSAGVPWDAALSFRADVGTSLGEHVAAALGAMGYEYDVVRRTTVGPNGETHDLRMWNPGGRGTSHPDGSPSTPESPWPDGAALVLGANVEIGGRVQHRAPRRTHLLVEDDSGDRVEVTHAGLSGRSRREGFLRAEYAPNVEAATRVGEHALEDDISNLVAVQLRITGQVEPYERFEVGSLVPFLLGRHAPRHDRRISTVSVAFGDGVWRREVTASRVFAATSEGQLTALYEAVRRLYAEWAARRRPRPGGAPPRAGGAGGMATLLVMPADHPQAAKADIVTPPDNVIETTRIINQALWSAQGGTVWLDGAFGVDADGVSGPIFVPDSTTLRGVSPTTTLFARSTPTAPIVRITTWSRLMDLIIQGVAGGGPG